MGLSKIYRQPQTELYRKITREDIGTRDVRTCFWCDAPLLRLEESWCSKECEHAYTTRARHEDLRLQLIDRDAAICEECGKHEIHYVMGPRVAVSKGGGSCGVDMMRTLCEPCMLSGVGTVVDVERPPLPTTVNTLRRLWKAASDRHRRIRYALGPTIVSGVNWARALEDWCKGKRQIGPIAYGRTNSHLRLVLTSLRWFQIVEANTEKPGRLLKDTLLSLQEQKELCARWAGYFRTQQIGVFD